MLVLSRKSGESIVIDDQIHITITKKAGNRVSVAIAAPEEISIERKELWDRRQAFYTPAPDECALALVE